MASQDLTYKVGVDASDAVSGLRKLEGAVRSTMREVGEELDDSATAGDKFAASIDRLSDQMREDFSSAAVAAQELQDALRRAGSSLEVGDAIAELSRMGISFDEITADADKFAASLKQLDDVRLQGVADLDSVAPGLATKLDDVGKSADSSKGALANMIGNSAQDLGNLGGAAGSTGVLIGQMAEYMADAKLEGEKMGSVLKSFAAVAGPAALLAAGVGVLTNLMGEQAARAEESAKRTETFGDAMEGAADDSVGLADSLRTNTDLLSEFDATAQGFGGSITESLAAIGRGIPLLGGLLGDTAKNITDLIPLMDKAGLSIYDFAQAVEEGGLVGGDWTRSLLDAADAGKLTETEYAALSEAVTKYGSEAAKARLHQDVFNVSIEEANAILRDTVAQSAPLEQYGELWATLFADMADGTISTTAAADAINTLAENLGMTREEVIALGQEEVDRRFEEQAQATEEATRALKDHRIAAANAAQALGELGASLDGIRRDAITGVFEAFGRPEADAGKIRDIAGAIAELPQAFADLEDVNVGDIMAGSFKADSFLDSIDGIAGQMRERMAEQFAAGNAQGAKDVAEQTIRDIVDSLGGKLTGDQVAELLGLTDLEAQVDVALNLSKLESVRQQLAILTGVSGETPLTASIALALNAGTITPEAAEILVQAQLGQAGVVIPSTLDTPNTEDALAEAGRFVADQSVAFPTELDTSGAEDDAHGFARSDLDPATIPLEADPREAERKAQGFRDTTERTRPSVTVDANTAGAVNTMLYLKILSAILQPEVTVTANTTSARNSINALERMDVDVPVEAYLADYPTASEIVARIGRPRIPVDIVVGTSIRITGVRE